jgi:hypothetical protein
MAITHCSNSVHHRILFEPSARFDTFSKPDTLHLRWLDAGAQRATARNSQGTRQLDIVEMDLEMTTKQNVGSKCLDISIHLVKKQ